MEKNAHTKKRLVEKKRQTTIKTDFPFFFHGGFPASNVVITWHKKGEKMIQTRIAKQRLPFFFHAGLP